MFDNNAPCRTRTESFIGFVWGLGIAVVFLTVATIGGIATSFAVNSLFTKPCTCIECDCCACCAGGKCDADCCQKKKGHKHE